jgi:hypothetical protein
MSLLQNATPPVLISGSHMNRNHFIGQQKSWGDFERGKSVDGMMPKTPVPLRLNRPTLWICNDLTPFINNLTNPLNMLSKIIVIQGIKYQQNSFLKK